MSKLRDGATTPADPNRREFLRRSGVVAATIAGSGVGLGRAMRASAQPGGQRGGPASKREPNLLFVFSDQQSYDMLGCNGNDQVITPRTDAFAKEGVRFTHCFSNAPVCTPYRGMLMSGKHPLHNGAFENDFPICPAAGPHFGDVLEAAGYRTGYIGKWHLLGGDRQRPVPVGLLRSGFNQTFYSDNCTTEYRAGHSFYYNDAGEKIIYDQWQPYSQTDQAIAFLEHSAEVSGASGGAGGSGGGKPFALFVSWHPPHDHGLMRPHPPRFYDYRHHPEELSKRYAGKDISLRPGVEDSPLMRELTRDYYAMCSGVDVAFGRLLDSLKAQGLDDNTIVVFTSDHGDMLGRYPNSPPKRPIHDTSSRVPLIIKNPQQPNAGLTSDLLISGLDLMPTLLGMMGLKAPDDVHGQDLSDPIFRGQGDAVASIPMLMVGWPIYRGVVTRDWSFSMGPEGQGTAFNSVLFDRRHDPDQMNNLYDDPDRSAIRQEMEKLTRRWMDRFEDPFITIPDLAAFQPIKSWQEPPGDPQEWPTPIDVFHGRAVPAA